MIIKPVSKGFICLTAHPAGCAANVREQIDYVRAQGPWTGPKNVLVIGASTGYGLASRISAAFGAGANTLGVFFEKPADGKRTASPGWYNTAAFETAASQAGLVAKSLNGDAFSDDIKRQAVALIKKHFGPIDLIVYSLASPRRLHPRTGATFTSVLKPIGAVYTTKSANFQTGQVGEMSFEPATEEEIAQTVGVMGGEDWAFWIDALEEAGVLALGARTAAYSYIGPALTAPIYRNGTIGRAKDHLETTSHALDARLGKKGGRAVISVNKALVTQASAAIPAMPLYISLLFKVMKSKGLHEGTIEQIHRLFRGNLYNPQPPAPDAEGRIRIDDREMRPEIQAEIAKLWAEASTENVEKLADLHVFREEFFRLFGFGFPGVDYDAEADADVPIPSLAETAPAGASA